MSENTINIQIRVAKKRKVELQKIAASLGMTLSAFLRQAAMFEANRVLGEVRQERKASA